jgi:hypothetical protein
MSAAPRADDRPSRLSDALPGSPAFAWIFLPPEVSADGLPGREIAMDRLGPTIVATYYAGDRVAHELPAVGRTERDEDLLRTAVTERGQVIAFAAQVDTRGGQRWLRLQIHEIEGRHEWGQLSIGADETALRSVTASLGGGHGWEDALRWLRGRLLFPGPPGPRGSRDPADPGHGGRQRLVCVVPSGQDVSKPVSCQLRGDGVAATLRHENGEWRIRSVHRDAGSTREGQRVAVIHANADFYIATVKARLRRQMREELARLAREGEADQSFLATWQRYHEMENRYVLRRMRDLGYLEYGSWSYLEDAENVIRFEIAGGRTDLLSQLNDEVNADREVELECAVALPEILGGAERPEQAAGLLELDLAKGNEVGSVVRADPGERIVDLAMVRRRGGGTGAAEDPPRPPRRGFLHAAVMGDRRRLERRQQALKRLLDGRIPLPQLLSLLQGTAARGKDPRPVPPLSPAAAACFISPANAEQRLALATALNTPDIAVIQGPPGTGKTQLIAALQIRLAEEKRAHAVVSRSMLLTSYQHAAVDNLVERSKVWDLPAIKIDSRNRGSTAHIENWRKATIQALNREMSPDGRRTLAMREVARATAGYCQAPVRTEELVSMLGRVRARITGLASGELCARLEQLEMELQAVGRIAGLRADPRRESTLRAVRGIRCEPTSFEDDGPIMAVAALEYLAGLPAADDDDRDLLRRAADWTDAGPPDFLPQLAAARDQLLDRLTDTADRLVLPVAREDVVDLLNAVVDDLDAGRRSASEGIHVALQEYLDDLEGDPEAVLATLRLYTTSLATTCQQADSKPIKDAKDGERLFDTVIVDEAARANPLDLLIPLTLAGSRVILVGDQNQLPHMLEPDVEQELRTDASDTLSRLRESLFGRLFTLLQHSDTPGTRRAVRLREQFRMHPVLGRFVSENFYEGNLDSPRPAAEFTHGLSGYQERPAAWLRVPGESFPEHGGQSKSRPAEAWAIAAELHRYIRERPDLTFGVISFYAAQVRLIWQALVNAGLAERAGAWYRPQPDLMRDQNGAERNRLQVGTVDAFQGKQFDVAFLSVTRSSRPPRFEPGQAAPGHPGYPAYETWARRAYGHLMMRNRLCVAMSRQERLLVVAGDDAMFTSAATPVAVAPLREFYRLCAPPSSAGILLPAPGLTRMRR